MNNKNRTHRFFGLGQLGESALKGRYRRKSDQRSNRQVRSLIGTSLNCALPDCAAPFEPVKLNQIYCCWPHKRKAEMRRHREKHAEEIRAYKREYYAKNKLRIKIREALRSSN